MTATMPTQPTLLQCVCFFSFTFYVQKIWRERLYCQGYDSRRNSGHYSSGYASSSGSSYQSYDDRSSENKTPSPSLSKERLSTKKYACNWPGCDKRFERQVRWTHSMIPLRSYCLISFSFFFRMLWMQVWSFFSIIAFNLTSCYYRLTWISIPTQSVSQISLTLLDISLIPTLAFVCPVSDCGKAFNVRSNMRRHLLTHKEYQHGADMDEDGSPKSGYAYPQGSSRGRSHGSR